MTVNNVVVGEGVGGEGVELFESSRLGHCKCLEEGCVGDVEDARTKFPAALYRRDTEETEVNAGGGWTFSSES